MDIVVLLALIGAAFLGALAIYTRDARFAGAGVFLGFGILALARLV